MGDMYDPEFPTCDEDSDELGIECKDKSISSLNLPPKVDLQIKSEISSEWSIDTMQVSFEGNKDVAKEDSKCVLITEPIINKPNPGSVSDVLKLNPADIVNIEGTNLRLDIESSMSAEYRTITTRQRKHVIKPSVPTSKSKIQGKVVGKSTSKPEQSIAVQKDIDIQNSDKASLTIVTEDEDENVKPSILPTKLQDTNADIQNTKQKISQNTRAKTCVAGSIPVNRDHSYSRKIKVTAAEKLDISYASDNPHEESNDSVGSGSGINNSLPNPPGVTATVLIPDSSHSIITSDSGTEKCETTEKTMNSDEDDMTTASGLDTAVVMVTEEKSETKNKIVASSVVVYEKPESPLHSSLCSENLTTNLVVAEFTEDKDIEENVPGSPTDFKDLSGKKKIRRNSNTIIKPGDQSSSSSADDIPVRRSSRIRSIEEKKEKDKDPKPKKERTPKTIKQDMKKKTDIKMEKSESPVGSDQILIEPKTPEPPHEECKALLAFKNDNRDDSSNGDTNSIASNDSSAVIAESKPTIDVKHEEDCKTGPLKVKSRWRRSSELERVCTTVATTASGFQTVHEEQLSAQKLSITQSPVPPPPPPKPAAPLPPPSKPALITATQPPTPQPKPLPIPLAQPPSPPPKLPALLPTPISLSLIQLPSPPTKPLLVPVTQSPPTTFKPLFTTKIPEHSPETLPIPILQTLVSPTPKRVPTPETQPLASPPISLSAVHSPASPPKSVPIPTTLMLGNNVALLSPSLSTSVTPLVQEIPLPHPVIPISIPGSTKPISIPMKLISSAVPINLISNLITVPLSEIPTPTSMPIKTTLDPIPASYKALPVLDPLSANTILIPITAKEESTPVKQLQSTQDSDAKQPQFDAIEDNIYLFDRRRSKSKKEVRRMQCDCTLTKEEREDGVLGCTADCLNRLLMIECGSRCSLGEACSNKRFQKKEHAKTQAFRTLKKGWGLKTTEDLPSGAFVMEYVGEVLSPMDFKQRVKNYARGKNDHYYFMALKGDEIIDATLKGNLSRFINHSCDPNCETQKWTVNGELRIGFFTTRSVKTDEELNFDYQFQRYGREAQRCYCDSNNCRGFIGGDSRISLKSGKSYVVQKKQRSKNFEERKREELEDLALEEEIEKLSSNGGLRNQQQTLMLARLMVRAEDHDTRQRLLDIIQNTTEQACLRLFLDYHGLPLLWSWMVDLGDDATHLKNQILQILSLLPISNKTMLLDSKVMNVVQRWASQDLRNSGVSVKSEPTSEAHEQQEPSPASIPSSRDSTPQPMASFNSESFVIDDLDSIPLPPMPPPPIKKPKAEFCIEDTEMGCFNQEYKMEKSSGSSAFNRLPALVTSDVSTTTSDDSKEASTPDAESRDKMPEFPPVRLKKIEENGLGRSDSDESHDTAEEEEGSKRNVYRMAAKILESWNGLKEVFRIPRVEQEKRKEDERAAAQQHYLQHQMHLGRDWEESPPRHGSIRLDNSPSPRSRKRIKEIDAEHFIPIRNPIRSPLLPTPPKMSKEERRQQFAMEVQQRDQEEAMRRQQEMSAPLANYSTGETFPYMYNQNIGYSGVPYDPNIGYSLPPAPPMNSINTNAGGYAPMDHNTCYPPAVDHNTGYPLPSSSIDHSGYPIQVNTIDQNIGYSVSGPPLDPNTGYLLPPPPINHNTGFPIQTRTVDSNIGFPLQLAHNNSVVLPEESHHQAAPIVTTSMHPVYAHNPNQVVSYQQAPHFQPPPQVSYLHPLVSSSHTVSTSCPLVDPHHPIVSSSTATPIPSFIPPASPSLPAGSPLVVSSPSIIPSVQNQVLPAPSPLAIAPGPAGTFVPPATTQPYITSAPPQAPPQLYYVQPTGTVIPIPAEQAQLAAAAVPSTLGPVVHVSVAPPPAVEELPSPTPKHAKPSLKLPPGWKTAKDDEGNLYYYHSVSRETQWDPPTVDDDEDDDDDGDSMDLGTPTFDEPKVGIRIKHHASSSSSSSSKKKTTTAAADTSSEVAKKIKELFRSKMSSYIVQCLNPYRKPDCKVGRITNTEDFKHLARKLTHFVMSKELKYCKNVDDLECNESVKHKAKDFVYKYMSKYGPEYRKDKHGSPRDF